MTTFILTAERGLLEKIAETIDLAETYHESVRRPGYVTERHADIDEHPDGGVYAYPVDEVWVKRLPELGVEFEKYGLSKEALAAKTEAVQDAPDAKETAVLDAGEFAGVALELGVKAADWTPKDMGLPGKSAELGDVGVKR